MIIPLVLFFIASAVYVYFANAEALHDVMLDSTSKIDVDPDIIEKSLSKVQVDMELGEPFKVYPIETSPDSEEVFRSTLIEYPFGSSPRADSQNNVSLRGIILYVHGYNDYYFQKELAEKADSAGFAFFAIDLHYCGRSYVDGEPLLIDPGVGEYTAKTFSNSRYEIWTMQSGYHNLPQINGTDQQDGKAFGAKVVSHQNGKLTLDIAGAYPQEAAVKSWKRTVTATKSGVSVTEDFELDAYKAPTRLMLMTTNRDALKHISYNANQLEAVIEDISNQLDPLLQGVWGPKMYRVVLTVKSAKTKQQIKYSIK